MKPEIPIELANYKKIKIKSNKVSVDEKEVKKVLDYLQNSRAKIITVNKPAKPGNRIEIDFEIRLGEVKIENGVSKNHPLILGNGHFVPGFEKELEGMNAGQEKEFSLKIPAGWPDKNIADKQVDFKVKMNLVQERELPEINDDFARSLGNFESLDALKGSAREGLLQEQEIKEKERIRLELIDKIAEASKMEIPSSFIDEELELMTQELKASIISLGLDFERYLQEIKKTIDELKKDWRKQAERRVKIGLCLKAIAQKEKIDVGEEEIEQRINEELKHHNMKVPTAVGIPTEVGNIDLEKLKEYTKNVLINEKVFALLEREAEII